MPKLPGGEHRALYRVGDACKSGETIALLLGDGQVASVFTTTDGQLRWEYHLNGGTPPPERAPAVSVFNELMTNIKLHVPKHRHKDAYAQLGKALHTALEGGDTEESFASVACRIDTLSLQQARYLYVLWFLGVAVILCFVLGTITYFLSPSFIRTIVQGGVAGSVGAAVSVLQRSNRIAIEPDTEPSVVALLGGSRALLGCIFGSFFVMASAGNLVAGVVSDEVFVVLTLAVVAGFSERLIPELLRKLEGGSERADASSTKETSEAR